ncbi:hypothetical protein EON83_18615 [bacterium]|nr:MAG: hypothetical protein EON83_18615 [bacterium]
MNCHWTCGIGVVLMGVAGCASCPDVEINGPTLTLDTTNPILPVLSEQLGSHSNANTFRVSWAITPDPNRPLESLPHTLLYNRKDKLLSIHLDRSHFLRFTGVTDEAIQRIASKKASAEDLARVGCVPQILPES